MKTWLANALTVPLSNPVRNMLLNQKVIIFGFHRCVESDPAYVETHDLHFLRESIRTLKRKGINFISVRQIVDSVMTGTAIPPGSVAFTADDGFWDQAELCANIFLEERCPLTIFLITDFLDGRKWPSKLEWLIDQIPTGQFHFDYKSLTVAIDTRTAVSRKQTFATLNQLCRSRLGYESQQLLDHLANQFRLSIPPTAPEGLHSMTWEQARRLEKMGIDFGPHSVTHTALSALSDLDTRFEIEQSWRRIKEELDNPLKVIAWPYGTSKDFGPRECDIAQEIGLAAALNTNNAYGLIPETRQSFYTFDRLALPTNEKDLILYTSWIEPFYQMVIRRD